MMSSKEASRIREILKDITHGIDSDRKPGNDLDYNYLMAYSIGKDLSVELAVSYVEFCAGKRGMVEAMNLCYLMMSSERHCDHFLSLCSMSGILIDVHNFAVESLVVKKQSSSSVLLKNSPISEKTVSEILLSNLGDIVEENRDRVHMLKKLDRGSCSDLVLSNMISRHGDAKEVIASMTFSEMAGCQKEIGNRGYPFSLKMSENTENPLESLVKLSKKDIDPFFDQLMFFMTANEAQSKIDKFTKNSFEKVFIKTDHINSSIKKNLGDFLDLAIRSDTSFHKNALRLVIGAYRNDCKLGIIDEVLGRDVDKLIESKYITMSDLDSMPIALNRNSLKKLVSDIGLSL